MAVTSNNGGNAAGGEEAGWAAGTPPPAPEFGEAGVCTRCHAALPRFGAGGGCPRCMMRLVLSEEENLFDPVTRPHEEVRRYSHFEIALETNGSLSELGHGAMGTTYRAHDTVLHAAVALKVIGRNVADSPTVRARFLREARAAARLRHPNVASVFHYGEQEGECFYVMELVEGETLEQRVRRDGPLPAEMALEVTTQVAHALAAAEARGIVHRDLKPSNVMLSSGQEGAVGGPPLVKVIDFGLAKAMAADVPILGMGDTRGGFVGTPAFASPEQFARKEDERIDTRSDIYSLGVTLWYLLCGKMPFVGKTLTEVHEQQTRRPLPLEQLKAARVPAPLMALLRSMLAVAPAARPQSARELLDALHRSQQQLLRASRTRYAKLAGALGVLSLAILGFALWREYTRRSMPPPDRSVAVLPFENISPDPKDTFFTSGMEDEITADLARIAELKVVRPGGDSAHDYPPGQRNLVQVARELGVGHLIEATVRRKADRIQIRIKLTDIHDKALNWTKQYSGPLSDVFAIQLDVTREVANQLRATLSPGEKAAIDEPPTNDPVAYDLYLRACEGPTVFKSGAELRRGLMGYAAQLQEAIARDPKFVLAYCALAQMEDEIALRSGTATAEERAVDHGALAEIALEKARRLKPDDGTVHMAEAHHLLVVSQDNEQARIELDLARRTLPNDADLEQGAGLIAWDQGRGDDAVRAMEKASSLQPHEPVYYIYLLQIDRSLRRYAAADRASEHVLENDRNDVFQLLWRAEGPLEERADLTPLRVALDAVQPAEPADVATKRHFELIYALFAHDPGEVSRTLAATPQLHLGAINFTYPKAWFEGLAARMRGDNDGARAAFERARQDTASAVQATPGDTRSLGLLAMIDAGLGRKEDAGREGRRACELMPATKNAEIAPVVACQLAVVYAWTGQPDLALEVLEHWAGRQAGDDLLFKPSYGDLRLNPVWDPLRSNSRFDALLERLAPKSRR